MSLSVIFLTWNKKQKYAQLSFFTNKLPDKLKNNKSEQNIIAL